MQSRIKERTKRSTADYACRHDMRPDIMKLTLFHVPVRYRVLFRFTRHATPPFLRSFSLLPAALPAYPVPPA